MTRCCTKLVKAIEIEAVITNLLKPEQIFTPSSPRVLIEFCPWCGERIAKRKPARDARRKDGR